MKTRRAGLLLASIGLSVCLCQNSDAKSYKANFKHKVLISQAPQSNSSQLGFTINLNSKGEVVVESIIATSQAAQAGISNGDSLISVDGLSIQGRSLSSINQKLRGVPGSYVDLTFSSKLKGEFTERIKRTKVTESGDITNNPKVTKTRSNTFKSTNSKNNASNGTTLNNNYNKLTNNLVTGQNSSASQSSKYGSKKPVATSSFKTLKTTPKSTNVKTSVPPTWTTPNKWYTYTNKEQTLSMLIPDGWEASTDNKTGKIQTYSNDNESLTILPFFLPDKKIQTNQALGLFKAMVKTMASTHNWSKPEVQGLDSIKATYNSDSVKEVVSLNWRVTQNGTVGRFFIAEAPDGYSKHYSMVYTKILSNLKFIPKPLPQGQNIANQGQSIQAPNVVSRQWTTFVDPKQGAFSLEVPAGWNVSGGMDQPMAVDTRGWVRAVSPDQKIVVFIGDGRVPSFTLPTMQLTSLGFPPGANYSPGYGFNTIVAYYLPAHKFVPKYGVKILKKLSASNIQINGIQNQPTLAKQWNQGKGANIYSAASCKINCMANGTPMTAFFIGSTRKHPPLWYMTLMTGIYCNSDKELEAMQVYSHMYKTFKMNLNWQQGQLNVTKSFSKMMFQNWREVQSIMKSSWDYRNAVQDRTHRKVVNALRGTQDMVDPSSGTVYNVESGPNYHWINNDGYTVLGSNQYGYPGANWTKLTNMP